MSSDDENSGTSNPKKSSGRSDNPEDLINKMIFQANIRNMIRDLVLKEIVNAAVDKALFIPKNSIQIT